jgi:riboflavin synthase alpha subunit
VQRTQGVQRWKITFDQFVDLNRRVGGHDIDGHVVSTRTVADDEALRIAFQSGRVNDTSRA